MKISNQSLVPNCFTNSLRRSVCAVDQKSLFLFFVVGFSIGIWGSGGCTLGTRRGTLNPDKIWSLRFSGVVESLASPLPTRIPIVLLLRTEIWGLSFSVLVSSVWTVYLGEEFGKEGESKDFFDKRERGSGERAGSVIEEG